MTRIDKILALKETQFINGINPHSCSFEEIDKLYDLATKKGNTVINWTNDELLFLDGLKSKRSATEPIGKWSK